MHNGVFKTLREVVEFYNTRDDEPDWSKPEVAGNMEQMLLGNLQLSDTEIVGGIESKTIYRNTTLFC